MTRIRGAKRTSLIAAFCVAILLGTVFAQGSSPNVKEVNVSDLDGGEWIYVQ